VPGQSVGQEPETVRQVESASEPGPVRYALATASDRFLDCTLSGQCCAAQQARFDDERKPLLGDQCLSGFEEAQGSLGLAAIEVNPR
jgi:hypothetical protein